MRLFYKAINFATGKTVTAFFIKPNLERTGILMFKEWGEGLYYLDVDFPEDGPYCGKFFENGIPTVAQVFRRGKQPGIVYYR